MLEVHWFLYVLPVPFRNHPGGQPGLHECQDQGGYREGAKEDAVDPGRIHLSRIHHILCVTLRERHPNGVSSPRTRIHTQHFPVVQAQEHCDRTQLGLSSRLLCRMLDMGQSGDVLVKSCDTVDLNMGPIAVSVTCFKGI